MQVGTGGLIDNMSKLGLPNTPRGSKSMKVLGSMIALGVAMLLASPAFAADTSSQPLTRADCDKAGMHWDDGVNVCASKVVAPKVEAAPKTEGAPKAECGRTERKA